MSRGLTRELARSTHLANIAYFLAIGAVIVVAGFLAQLAYWYWIQPPVLTVNKFIVPGVTVKAGSLLTYHFDYCKPDKYADYYGNVQFSYIDTVGYNLPGVSRGPLPVGCNNISESVMVPQLPPGKYFLQMDRQYKVNPFWDQHITSRSNYFVIEPGTTATDPVLNDLLKANEELIRKNSELTVQNNVLLSRLAELINKLPGTRHP